MGDKPILFSGPMVRALLEGRKTQTRCVLKPQPPKGADLVGLYGPGLTAVFDTDKGADWTQRLRFIPGDRLWVREAFGYGQRPDPFEGCVDGIEYRADEAYLQEHDFLPLYRPKTPEGFCYGEVSTPGWRPSIHMPRWASRLTLLVTDVRVQRLQDISEEDAIAEGIDWDDGHGRLHATARIAFANLWDSINGNSKDKDGNRLPCAWGDNPWVVAVTFDPVLQNIDTVKE